jgi:signal transduction histidine kinase
MDLALAKALQQQSEATTELARASAAEQAYRKLLEAVVNEMPVGVIVADAPSGRIVIDNAAMGRIMHGTPTPGSAGGERRSYRAFHDDGRPYRSEEWPLTRSAAAGETVREEELDVERDDGSRATISVSSIPIRADGEAIIAAVATISDITRRREADTLRDAFIGVLSHELRTPITSIYGGSKVLLRDGVEARPEVRRTVLEDLVGESERLNRMVENLLVLARVERGVTLTGHEPVLLQRLLPRIVADEARLWPGLDLVLDVADDVPTVAGDESFIDQVLRNYLSNAGKYGPPRGTVRIDVGVRPAERDVRIAVRDEGDGIDDEEAARLFDLFFRSSSVANKKAGSGIGLFVSRHLVEGMGGRVWAHSRPEGGSEFGFSLPIYELA